MSDEKLLDDGFTGGGEFRPVSVNAGIRFANAIIDGIALFGVGFVVGLVIGDPGFLGYGISFIYFLVLEGSTGKSLGKMVTGCKVVTEYGDRPDYGAVALRTIIRFIPFFDAISVFFRSDGRMWHDLWSKTYVVKDSQYV